MGDGELPLEIYARYKANIDGIQKWRWLVYYKMKFNY